MCYAAKWNQTSSFVKKTGLWKHTKHPILSLNLFVRSMDLLTVWVHENLFSLLSQRWPFLLDGQSTTNAQSVELFSIVHIARTTTVSNSFLSKTRIIIETTEIVDEHIKVPLICFESMKFPIRQWYSTEWKQIFYQKIDQHKAQKVFFGRASHRIRLFVREVIVEQVAAVSSVRTLLSTLRIPYYRQSYTGSLSRVRNSPISLTTRARRLFAVNWKDFFFLCEHVGKLGNMDFNELLHSVIAERRIDFLIKNLKYLNKFVPRLWHKNFSLRRAPELIDSGLNVLSTLKTRLHANGRKVYIVYFVPGKFQMQDIHTEALTAFWKGTLRSLRLQPFPESCPEEQPKSIVESALKKSKFINGFAFFSVFTDTEFLFSTLEIREDLFFIAGNALTIRLRHALVCLLELKKTLFFQIFATYCSVEIVNSVVRGNQIYIFCIPHIMSTRTSNLTFVTVLL